jgi:hypothetical protein
MAKQLQFRRGTTAETALFVGALGEITVDTDKLVTVVHDGATSGGFPGAREDDVIAANVAILALQGNVGLLRADLNVLDPAAVTASSGQLRANIAAANVNINNLQSLTSSQGGQITQIQLGLNAANAAVTAFGFIVGQVQADTIELQNGALATNAAIINLDGRTFANAAVQSIAIAGVQANVTSANAQILLRSNIAGDTFTGNMVFNAQTPSTSVNTGSMVVNGGAGIDGNLFVGGTAYFGNTAPIVISTPLMQATGNANSYVQMQIQNISSSSYASSDFVATADTGTDIANFVDLGINNSNFANPAWTMSSALDGYVYVNGGNLTVGTDTPNKVVRIHAGGTLTACVVATFNAAGTTSGSQTTGALVVNGGIGTNGAIHAVDVTADRLTGTLQTNAQPSINTVGILTDLDVNSDNDIFLLAAGNIYVKGNIISNTATASSSTTTGALVIPGGVGIGGNLYAGNLHSSSSLVARLGSDSQVTMAADASSGSFEIGKQGRTSNGTPFLDFHSKGGSTTDYDVRMIVSGGITTESGMGNLNVFAANTIIQGNLYLGMSTTNVVTIVGTTTSTSTTTGAFVVRGGVGIGDDLFVEDRITASGNVVAAASTAAVSINTGALVVANGGFAVSSGVSQLGGNVVIVSSTESVSSSTGALVVRGGVAVQKKLQVSGNIVAASSQSSTGTTSGALIVTGGAGIGGNVNAGSSATSTHNLIGNVNIVNSSGSTGGVLKIGGISGVASSTGLSNQALQVTQGGMGVNGDSVVQGIFRVLGGNLVVDATTPSSGTTTGAVVITGGGLGVFEDIHAGGVIAAAGNIVAESTTESSSTTTGSLVSRGGIASAKVITAGGNIVAAATTESVSTSTGSIVTLGGIGAAKVITAGGNLVAAAATTSISTTTGALVVNGGAGVAGNIYVGGNISIGGGNIPRGNSLILTQNITGAATAFAVNQTGIVQSPVTTEAVGFRNSLTTASQSFTLPAYSHFKATQGTMGIGATVTNQYGFFADSSLDAAGTNFGFYGAMTSGWNLYMAGSAPSYIGSRIGLGATPIAQAELTAVNIDTDNTSAPIYSGYFVTGTTALGGAGEKIGVYGASFSNVGYTGSGTQIGVVGLARQNATINTGPLVGVRGEVQTSAVGITSVAIGLQATETLAATSTVSTIYGVKVDSISAPTSGTVNAFGVQVGDMVNATNMYAVQLSMSSGTNKWNIFANGSAANHFNGDVRIGTTTATGKFDVAGSGGTISVASSGQSLTFSAAATNTINATNASGLLALQTNSTTRLNIVANGAIVLDSTTVSTSVNTGALIVKGGVGIGDDLYVNDRITTAGNIVSTSSARPINSTGFNGGTGALVLLNGGASIYSNVQIGGYFAGFGPTEATAIGTGALVVDGGISSGGRINASGRISIVGTGFPAPVGTTYYGGFNLWLPTTSTGDQQIQATGPGQDFTIRNAYNIGLKILGLAAGNVVVDSTTESTGSTTGSIVTLGGVGIAKRLNVAGNIVASSGTASSSSTTGALVVSGGIGVSGDIYTGDTIIASGNVVANSGTASTTKTTGAMVVNGGLGVTGSQYVDTIYTTTGIFWEANGTNYVTGIGAGAVGTSGDLQFNNAGVMGASSLRYYNGNTSVAVLGGIASTSTTSGSFQVLGGVGVTGALYNALVHVSGGNVVAAATTESTSTVTGSFVALGGVGIANRLNVGGNVVATATTESTGTTTGSIVTLGGVGIANRLNVGGNIVAAATTASTNTTTGSFVALGGVGIAGAVYAGSIQNTPVGSTTPSTGAFTTLSASTALYVSASTASTTSNTGAIVTPGGLGIGGAIYAGGIASISGNITAGAVGTTNQHQLLSSTVSVPNATALLAGAHTALSGQGGNYLAFGQNTGNFGQWIQSAFSNPTTATYPIILNPLGGNVVVGASTASTNTTTGALVVVGGAGIAGALYAGSVFDNGNRVFSTSTGAGNLSISGTAITLPTHGSGSGSSGSTTAIPVITTDAYGRVTARTTVAVATSHTVTGTTGSQTISNGGTLSFTSTNGVTAVVGAGPAVTVNTPQDLRTTASPTFAGLTVSDAIVPSGNLTIDIGSTTNWFNNLYGRAIQTQYGDVAEKYLADAEYPVGTVVVVGGEAEVTACGDRSNQRAVGVVSENPAVKMNAMLEGGTFIALKGRVPVLVHGAVKKGEALVAGNRPDNPPGTARSSNEIAGHDRHREFAIALETNLDSGVKIVEAIIL